jgi:hypothetical protein
LEWADFRHAEAAFAQIAFQDYGECIVSTTAEPPSGPHDDLYVNTVVLECGS